MIFGMVSASIHWEKIYKPKFDDKQLDQGYRCQPQDRARDIHPKINCYEVADFTAV